MFWLRCFPEPFSGSFDIDLDGLLFGFAGACLTALGIIILLVAFILALVRKSNQNVPIKKQRAWKIIKGSMIFILSGIFAVILSLGIMPRDFRKSIDEMVFYYPAGIVLFFLLYIFPKKKKGTSQDSSSSQS